MNVSILLQIVVNNAKTTTFYVKQNLKAKTLTLFFRQALIQLLGVQMFFFLIPLFNLRDKEMCYQSPRTQLPSPTKILNKGS